ncbi:hypothetical protein D3C78_760030 [compost metagenome]
MESLPQDGSNTELAPLRKKPVRTTIAKLSQQKRERRLEPVQASFPEAGQVRTLTGLFVSGISGISSHSLFDHLSFRMGRTSCTHGQILT